MTGELMNDYEYIGSELELFASATNWKSYFGSMLQPFIGPRVLEVGAGIGETTSVLCTGREIEWLCVEPDRRLAEKLQQGINHGSIPARCKLVVGTIEDIEAAPRFETILYIDVIEHLENDADELRRASTRLVPGGHLVVLSPAHPWLYSEFDKSIGHFRRYTKRSLAALTPPHTKMVRNFYLDGVGVLASLGNRLLLKSSCPTPRQIAVWDKMVVPLSRVVDRLLCYNFGKSVVGVWRRGPRSGSSI